MNIFTLFLQEIKQLTKILYSKQNISNDLFATINLEIPKMNNNGDISTNVAMVLAKALNTPPQELALQYKQAFITNSNVAKIDIAGPGFINITLTAAFWNLQLQKLLKEQQQYGHNNLGQNIKVNVEYVSTNPTGPLHIGHCRVAVVGDILANILQISGYQVTKEYYINDAGNQADQLAYSTYQRYLQALGENADIIGEYTGEYLIPIGKKLAKLFGAQFVNQSQQEWLPVIKKFAVIEMMKLIKADLAKLNIEHDIFTSEGELIKEHKVKDAIQYLQNNDLLYEGVLEKPKGFENKKWESRKQLLFKSTQFGDDSDRAIKKDDGNWTYFASDIAYHLDKIQRNYSMLINVWGADHGGYVKRLDAAVKALSTKNIQFKCLLCQMVKFIENGTSLKMSKRAGHFVTVSDLLSKTSVDAVRFMMVLRKNDAPLDFDLQKITEQSKDNPIFYVQYAYARCNSIKKRIQEQFPQLKLDNLSLANLSCNFALESEFMLLIKKLIAWPRFLEMSAQKLEPHRVAYYLYELASEFHSLWNKGDNDLSLRFIDEKSAINTQRNFTLIAATIIILQNGLKTLGIEPRISM